MDTFNITVNATLLFFAGHTQGVTSVRIGRSGTECDTLVASSSYDCTLRLWCSVAGECIAILK